jgi:hypothetical protein
VRRADAGREGAVDWHVTHEYPPLDFGVTPKSLVRRTLLVVSSRERRHASVANLARQGSTTPCHSDRQRHQAASGACRGMPPRRASATKRVASLGVARAAPRHATQIVSATRRPRGRAEVCRPDGRQRRSEWPAAVSPGQHQAMPLRSSAPPGGLGACRGMPPGGGQWRCEWPASVSPGQHQAMPLRSSARARGSAHAIQPSRFSAR